MTDVQPSSPMTLTVGMVIHCVVAYVALSVNLYWRKCVLRLRASKMEHGREWWRKRYERTLWHKWALTCLVEDRRGLIPTFAGSDRWLITVKGSRLYKIRLHANSLRFPSEGPVGRFHGKHLVLDKKLAPKWLKNWARGVQHVYILDSLDRGALTAHLMAEKLRNSDG